MTPLPGPASVAGAVRAATRVLERAGIASAHVDALELAATATGRDAGSIRRAMALDEALDAAAADRLADLVAERAHRIPLQHLTGRAYFRNLTLQVGPGVFIPRPETEVTAGLAIDAIRAAVAAGTAVPVVADLCAGSGAIAFAVADEVPAARVYAVELSPLAHAWAARNAETLGLNVELRLGDATTALGDMAGSVDVVVSNPPYIPAGQVPLDPEVAEHDPASALYGGSDDGLAIPRLVATRATVLLRPGGVLVMEHADTQGAALASSLRRTGQWADIVDHPDLTGRPRATVARARGISA